MAYTVLARKYRPQTFDDLVGQDHVARTVSNAIATERVAHAFLFTGARGVGKTTTARLLAKALNCANGPTSTPCNVCEQCTLITNGTDLDVLEIDGASNNSVEDVRRLQESIPYRPARDRFKIVIVDEVHMLSAGAFNALLKTLEEPPLHVKFIFATTESHKVPITIRSRCQRYDFRLIPQAVIAERIRTILSAENIQADDAAVALVAREAAGSMRDALTLLDQIVAFAGNELRGSEVAEVLGVAGRDQLFEVVGSMLDGRGADTMRTLDALFRSGVDVLTLARQLLELLRDLVVLSVAGDDEQLVDRVEEDRKRATELAQRVSVLELERTFAELSKLVEDLAKSATPRLVLEMGLVRLATRPPLEPVGALVSRLEDLEKRLSSGGSGSREEKPGAATRRSAPSSPPPKTSAAPSIVNKEPAAPPPPRSEPASPPASKESVQPARADDTPRATGNTLETWEKIVEGLREHKPALAAILEHGVPVEVSTAGIVLGFPEGSFFGKQADAIDARTAVAEAGETVLGARVEVQVRFGVEASNRTSTVAQVFASRRDDRREATRREALSHPRVLEAMQVFPESADAIEVRFDSD